MAVLDEFDHPYCKDCVPGKEADHACPGCGTSVAGSGNGQCRPCLNKKAVLAAAELAGATMGREWVRSLLRDYATWLYTQRSQKPALHTFFLKHVDFFARLDVSFDSVADVTGDRLVEQLGSRFLRKYLLASQFTTSRLGLTIDLQGRSDSSNRATVVDKLARNSRTPYGSLLRQYGDWLGSKETSPRTARLYLRAAERFCQSTGTSATRSPTVAAVAKFASTHPGSLNSAKRFVTFLNSAHGMQLHFPSGQIAHIQELVAQMRQLIEQSAVHENAVERERVLGELIGFALDLDVRAITQVVVDEAGNAISVRTNADGLITVPAALATYITAWHQLRSGRRLTTQEVTRAAKLE